MRTPFPFQNGNGPFPPDAGPTAPGGILRRSGVASYTKENRPSTPVLALMPGPPLTMTAFRGAPEWRSVTMPEMTYARMGEAEQHRLRMQMRTRFFMGAVFFRNDKLPTQMWI